MLPRDPKHFCQPGYASLQNQPEEAWALEPLEGVLPAALWGQSPCRLVTPLWQSFCTARSHLPGSPDLPCSGSTLYPMRFTLGK